MLAASAEPLTSDAALAGAEEESGPNRRCLVTGEVRPVAQLVRFVAAPDGGVVPDIEGRLPGRGMWLSAQRDVVNQALAKNAFARAARRPVAVSSDLADRVESLLARRCVELLGIARRAGQAVAGFDRVHAALAEGPGGMLIEAADGAEDGRGKLRPLARDAAAAALSSEEIGAAWGRERTVHVLLAPGKLAERLRAELGRLAGFRDLGAADRAAARR